MGNDGGSMTNKLSVQDKVRKTGVGSKNDDGGKMSARQQTEVLRAQRWRYCSLSQLPLWPPLCADRAGNLYRKEAVLQFLIARKAAAKAFETAKKGDMEKAHATLATSSALPPAITALAVQSLRPHSAERDVSEVSEDNAVYESLFSRYLTPASSSAPATSMQQPKVQDVKAFFGTPPFAHLQKMKDVVLLTFQLPKDLQDKVDAGETSTSNPEADASRLITCRASGLCASSAPEAPFVVVWSTGEVVSQRFLEQNAGSVVGGDADAVRLVPAEPVVVCPSGTEKKRPREAGV